MKDIELFELGAMTNRSPAMFDRRRRILAETRRMVAERGLDDFSVRDLADRAKVSSSTIYNAFGNRDQLVALSIKGYIEEFRNRLTFESEPGSFAGALDWQIAVSLRIVALPNYLHAIAAIYFSATIPDHLRKVLIDIGSKQWAEWLRAVRVKRGIEPWADTDMLLQSISDLQWSHIHNWAIGMMEEEEFVARSTGSVLTHLAGATRGEPRSEIASTMRQIKDDAPEWKATVAAVEAKLEVFSNTL